MKDLYALQKARENVVSQLRLVGIANTHQRAMLVGLLTALDWIGEVGDKDKNSLQQLLDGRPILPNAETIAEAGIRRKAEEATKSRRGQTFIMP